ncbi:MAG: alpha-amylase family glycosyl hydrolase [Chitinophagales bacterium]
MFSRYTQFWGLLLIAQLANAQVVTTIPVFPTVDEPVTIIFDATQGNGALADVPGPIYAHTGLITTESVSPTDWQYTQGVWGTADPEVLMTEIGDNLYQINYTSILDFYGATVDDTILQMAFVFRTTTGDVVGRDTDGSDIFVNVYEDGLNVAISSPDTDPLIVNYGDNVHITAESVFSDSLYLYINGVEAVGTDLTSIVYDLSATDYGLSEIRVVAKGAGDVKEDSTYFYVIGDPDMAAVPLGLHQGINYIDDNTVTLVLYAPYKQYIFAVGEHSNWMLQESSFMHLDPDNATWWVTLTGLDAGKEYSYQYFIDGTLWVADPLAEKVLDPWNDSYISEATYPGLIDYPTGKASGIVSVFQTAQPEYTWAIPEFTPPADEDLVVYELLVRDFVAARNYQTLVDTLSYLKNLGINAIELMPVMEFEGNESWGYNPSFFIALDKYYGTREAFKIFVDSCHANGIAVILDIAMNHAFGQSPLVQMWWDGVAGTPAANSPYFNQIPTHDYNVGYDFNHESNATRNMRNIIFQYWIQEYNVDGYRFDLSKGYTQTNSLGDVGYWGEYDASRIAIWKDISDNIHAVDSDPILILEHFAANSEEEVLSDYGFMLWGNSNYNYAQGTMGYSGSDVNWMSYVARGWADPHVMGYMESHDEERLMFKNITYGNSTNPDYNVKYLPIALSRMELAGAFFFPIPGPKMMWQFGELGYDISIDNPCRVCNKPILWNYYDVAARLRINQVWSELIKLKTTYPAFSTTNFALNVGGFGKRINLNNDAMNVTVIGNFDVNNGTVAPNFQHTGFWYEYFSGDTLNVADINAPISLLPGEYRLYTDVKLNTPDIIISIEDIQSALQHELTIAPNPSSDIFTFSADIQNAGPAQIEIFNMSGALVFSTTVSGVQPGTFNYTWNSANTNGAAAENGIYLVKINTADGVFMGKIIKQ